MAQKNRSKEIWLIPKRNSLHQTVCLIDGIIKRGYDGQSWNAQKQNNLGVNLKNWGATKSGKNISNQSIRTLLASIPEYLGFVYINNQTTPNSICLTEAGKLLWETHKDQLVSIKNLDDGSDNLLQTSDVVLMQMEKLQLTNPIYLKDCENILVFPFRLTLKLLRKLKYLDREEIAYFLLQTKDESEVDLKIMEIESFRRLSEFDRESLINEFKKTHIGNITLVQASSAAYYEGLCALTGIINRDSVLPPNKSERIKCIRIKTEYIDYVNDILDNKYHYAQPYDFKDDLNLWIEYIGDPKTSLPPCDVKITNDSNNDYLVQLYKGDSLKNADLILNKCSVSFPMFLNESYKIKMINIADSSSTKKAIITPTTECLEFTICDENTTPTTLKDKNYYKNSIIEHLSSSTFNQETLDYLHILSMTIGIDKSTDSALRGAYFEYYMFEYLTRLKAERKIDDVIWYGKIGKYGLPVSAPGGKLGEPDIVFIKNGTHYVLELTTIKSKSLQERTEIASVSDHIKRYANKTEQSTIGLFCAPVIHSRNTTLVDTILKEDNIPFWAFNEKDLFKYIENL